MKPVVVSYLRWALGYTVFVVCGLLFLVVSLIPVPVLMYPTARVLSRLILRSLGGRLRVEGRFPNDRAYIFMANHASFVDMFTLAAATRGRFTGVMAVEEMRYPLWGWILKRFRAIPIRRGDREAAIVAVKMAEQRLHAGYHVGLLPEGTRTLDGKLGPFKKGGFHMAFNTRAPILPIGIEGTFRLKPKMSRLLTPGPIIVRIGAPIPPEHYHRLSMAELMAEVREQLLVLTGEVSPDAAEA